MVIDRRADQNAGEPREVTLVIDTDQLRILTHAAALGAIGITDPAEKAELRNLLGTIQEVLDATP